MRSWIKDSILYDVDEVSSRKRQKLGLLVVPKRWLEKECRILGNERTKQPTGLRYFALFFVARRGRLYQNDKRWRRDFVLRPIVTAFSRSLSIVQLHFPWPKVPKRGGTSRASIFLSSSIQCGVHLEFSINAFSGRT